MARGDTPYEVTGWELCQGEIQTASQLLTPHLFCSLGYLSSGDRTRAKILLEKYNSKGGYNYHRDEPCKQVYTFLLSQF
jgi:hypothetical protein